MTFLKNFRMISVAYTLKPRYKQHACKQNSVISKRFQSPGKRYRNFHVMLLGYEQHGYRESSLTSSEKSSPKQFFLDKSNICSTQRVFEQIFNRCTLLHLIWVLLKGGSSKKPVSLF